MFVAHEASRTGAPLILLHFLHWFKANVGWPFAILLAKDGPLEDSFATLAPTAVLDRGPWRYWSLGRRILRKLGLERLGERLYRKDLARRLSPRPDLIYCNSIAAGPALDFLDEFDAPVLTHVHELKWFFRVGLTPEQLQRLMRRTVRYIGCSNAVGEFLARDTGVPVTSIDVVHEFLIRDRLDCDAGASKVECSSIPAGTKVVGAVGSLSWRKGTDLMIQVAREVYERDPGRSVRFVWVGDGEAEEVAQAEHDVRLAGLEGRVVFVGAVVEPFSYYKSFDVLMLPSREDPFPLVCLEAAFTGVPTVCFSDAGGAPEFVGSDCGFVVPYLDLRAMADRVIELLDDDDMRKRMGAAAREKVTARHTIESSAPRIVEVLEKALRDA